MSDPHSSPSGKPAKPAADFPLFPHASGQWAKKIRGKMYYFGVWDDPQGALARYREQKDALLEGRKPRQETGEATVKEAVNAFLNQKRVQQFGGDISPRTMQDYKDACDEVVAAFGKGRIVLDLDVDDFSALWKRMAAKWGPHRLGKTIQCIRCVFKYALDIGLIDRPVRFGPGFKRPSKKTFRVHRAERGVKLFTANEVRQLVEAASASMRAMILLGINCGFGNSDCGTLRQAAIDWSRAIIDYPRPKTGIPRRCPLWPETVAALQEALAKQPKAKSEADAALVFVTKYGESWAKDVADSPISKEMRKLLNKLGIKGHRNFYTLRHTFRTVADESKDQPAVDFIMGHEVAHMSAVYRETISDARLRAVVEHVRTWLFPSLRFLQATDAADLGNEPSKK